LITLSQLDFSELSARLCGSGLRIRTGSVNFQITSSLPSIVKGIHLLYSDYPLVDDAAFIDFKVEINRVTGVRRWWRPQIAFTYDGQHPFGVLPLAHAFPLLEWAMNWCISTQSHHFLIVHAAVLEREGCGVIMPAPPGSGKSTLCAGLVSRGWRLLSDELTLISLADGLLTPLGRPISLKNQSLDVIRQFYPGAVLNQVTHDTQKGSISHLKVPPGHVQQLEERARPRWVIFPKYIPGNNAELTLRSKANSLLELGRNSFNYHVLGLAGFDVLADVISASDCYDFHYSQLEDAVAVFDQLAMRERL
jgi:HprK-related kinase A